jgi:nucleotide-binding universal stress UspA family protein
MFAHILIPIDGSDLSRKAMLHGIQLAKLSGAEVTALTIEAHNTVSAMDAIAIVASQAEFDEESRAFAENALAQARMAAQAAGIEIETLREVNDHPAQAIVDCARANRCDLIVMGSRGRGAAAALVLGSVTTKVLNETRIPVLVYR